MTNKLYKCDCSKCTKCTNGVSIPIDDRRYIALLVELRNIMKSKLSNSIWQNLPPEPHDGIYVSRIGEIRKTMIRLSHQMNQMDEAIRRGSLEAENV